MATATPAGVRSRMTMRCTVERDANAADLDGVPDWQTHLSDQPCWLWPQGPGPDEDVSNERTAVVQRWRMILPAGTDVTERDRVNGVTNRRGESVLADRLNIRSVVNLVTHLELVLEGAR